MNYTGRFLAVGHTLGYVSVYSLNISTGDRAGTGTGTGTGTGRLVPGTRDFGGQFNQRDRQGWRDRGREGGEGAPPLPSVAPTLTLLCESRKLVEHVSDIKFSPNNKMLAVGSHDNFIDM